MGTGYAAKMGTGYAIPNFREIIVVVSLPGTCAKFGDCPVSLTMGKLGIA
jgi:hypothetical protein